MLKILTNTSILSAKKGFIVIYIKGGTLTSHCFLGLATTWNLKFCNMIDLVIIGNR